MKKNNIFMIFVGTLNLGLCLLLLFLCVPNKIAMFVNFNEKIILLASKWFMLFGAIAPFVFAVINLFLKNKPKTSFVLKSLIVFLVYENMLAFSYFSNKTSFYIGEISQIPLALSAFLPLSSAIIVWALKLKRIPYKSKFGINTKHSTKTEFIWKQTHIFASDLFFAYGFISFLITFIFVFTKFTYILLAINFLGFIFCWMFANKQAKIMDEKYSAMSKNKEKLDKKNKD